MIRKYKWYLLGIAGISASLLLAGCGNSSDSGSSTGSDSAQEADTAGEETDGVLDLEEIDDEALETEVLTLEPITPSDYLAADAKDYVTLGEYDDLEAVQYTYTVTDEMVQEEIDSFLEEYSEEVDTDAPSQEGDTVYLDLTASVQGSSEDPLEEEYYITVGLGELGSEFDEQITGLSVGDKKSFTITFDEDLWSDEWAGETVDFEIEVTGVTQLEYPEYNDDFVAENTSFETTSELEEYLVTYLEQEYLDMSYSDVVEELLAQAINETVFSGYPEEFYNSCREEVLSGYEMFAGDDDTSVEDILEAFGITDEMLDEEVESLVYRRLFISAYCEENDLTVSEEDYTEYCEQNAAYYDMLSPAEFEELYGRTEIVWNLYESLAAEELYEKADITQEEYQEEDSSELDLSDLEDIEEIDLEDLEFDGLEELEFETENTASE